MKKTKISHVDKNMTTLRAREKVKESFKIALPQEAVNQIDSCASPAWCFRNDFISISPHFFYFTRPLCNNLFPPDPMKKKTQQPKSNYYLGHTKTQWVEPHHRRGPDSKLYQLYISFLPRRRPNVRNKATTRRRRSNNAEINFSRISLSLIEYTQRKRGSPCTQLCMHDVTSTTVENPYTQPSHHVTN